MKSLLSHCNKKFHSSQVARAESVAGLHLAALVALGEPAHTLGTAAVGKGIRAHGAALLALQGVVTNLLGRVQGSLQIALLQPVARLLCVLRPNTSVAIGLQLQTHRQGVVLTLADAPTLGIDLGRGA